MTEKYFRGWHAIGEVMERVTKLAEHQQKFHPDAPSIRLFRKDYDLINRWPKAGVMHGFVYVEEGVIQFKGFVLSYDRSPKRYPEMKKAPEVVL